jgi:predicted nucleotidyltransferase component of viral defense system
LAGGTALLLKYQHRISTDLDLFLLPGMELNTSFYKGELARISPHFETIYEASHTLTIGIERTKISFFEYPYDLLAETETLPSVGIKLASDKDIACMKAVAVAQRGEKKDFYDLWYLMETHDWEIDNLIQMAEKKYPNYNSSILIKALTYFDDAENMQEQETVESRWSEIKAFFVNKVASWKERISPPRHQGSVR